MAIPDKPRDGDEPAPEVSGARPEANGAGPSKKKIWIILSAAALIVIAGVVGAVLSLGGDDEPGAVTLDIGGATAYQEFPEILTHLAGGEGTSNHAKLEIIIELPESQVDVLQDKEAVIVDAIQSYLRGKTREELSGEAGAERLRGELLVMINQRIAPAEAQDILFKTFLID